MSVYSVGETSSLIGLSCGNRHHCLSSTPALVGWIVYTGVLPGSICHSWAFGIVGTHGLFWFQFSSHSWASCRLIVVPNSVGSRYVLVPLMPYGDEACNRCGSRTVVGTSSRTVVGAVCSCCRTSRCRSRLIVGSGYSELFCLYCCW